MHLSERAPSITGELLHSVSTKCEDALRTEKESQASRKRPEPPNGDGSIAKRLKLDRVTSEKMCREVEKRIGRRKGIEGRRFEGVGEFPNVGGIAVQRVDRSSVLPSV